MHRNKNIIKTRFITKIPETKHQRLLKKKIITLKKLQKHIDETTPIIIQALVDKTKKND